MATKNTAARIVEATDRITQEVGRVLYGCEGPLKTSLLTLFAGGHALFIGVSGVGKTLLCQTLGEVLDLGFEVTTLTSDTMPSQLTGNEVLNPKDRVLEKRFGFMKPYKHLNLVDELTRGPGRLQSALLEWMNDRGFRIAGEMFMMEKPFMVMSCYNPVDNNGTYPLVGALVDRCYTRSYFAYPTKQQMIGLGLDRNHQTGTPIQEAKLNKVATREDVVAWQDFVREQVVTDPEVVEYIVNLVLATRPENRRLGADGAEYKRWMPKKYQKEKIIRCGASNRTVYMMAVCAKANAAMHGRTRVSDTDVKEIAVQCLAHKMVLDPSLEMSKPFGFECQIVEDLLEVVPTGSKS